MKNLMILTIALVFGGCYQKSVQGKLSVYETLTLNKGKKVFEIQPDDYTAKLNLNGKKKFQLVIPGVKGKTFTFKFPKQFVVPRNEGQLKLLANDLNQPVDVDLNFTTDTTRSAEQNATETCSRTYNDRVCNYETTPGGRICRDDHHGHRTCRYEPPRRRRVCRTIPRTEYGSREVTFRTVTKETYFNADLLKPNTDNLMANFIGREIKTKRENLYQGPCRLNYSPRRPW